MEQNSNETPEQSATPAEESKTPRRRASRRVTTPAGTAAETTAESANDSAPANEEAPKKRATRSRKKVEAEPTESAVQTEAPAEQKKTRSTRSKAATAPESAEPADAATAETVEKKPAARRTRKKAEAPAADTQTDATPDSTGETATEAPKRNTRSRRAKTETADSSDESSSAATDEKPAEKAAESGAPKGRSRSRKTDETKDTSSSAAESAESEKGSKEQPDAADDSGSKQTDASGENEKGSRRGRRGRGSKSQDNNSDQSNTDAQDQSNQQSSENEDKNDANSSGDSNNRNQRKDKNSSRSRTRQRDRKRRGNNDDGEIELTEDDVLLPIAGILDVLDNYAFVRTTGYLPGDSDVYVSLSQVKRYNLRKGDAIVGAIRQPREGEHSGRQKYNAIVKVDSVNGQSTDDTAKRAEFDALTPIRPAKHVQLASQQSTTIIRGIDLFTPVALGQRGLILNPDSAAPVSTQVASEMADSLTEKLPDAHVMMLLVGSRPEDVTELTRSVKGEVIAASSDAAPEDQVTVVELAFERAKRLVELGHDVIVFVDSLDAIASALHLVTPPQHRNPLGGLTDGAIINTLKRLLSAARNIENRGSLSIYASATEYLFVGEQTIHAITNWELALQESASHSSGASAFEISDSYALHTGDLVSPTVAAGTDALRVLLNDAEEGASLPEWLNPNASRKVFELLQDTADNDQFLVKLAQKLA